MCMSVGIEIIFNEHGHRIVCVCAYCDISSGLYLLKSVAYGYSKVGCFHHWDIVEVVPEDHCPACSCSFGKFADGLGLAYAWCEHFDEGLIVVEDVGVGADGTSGCGCNVGGGNIGFSNTAYCEYEHCAAHGGFRYRCPYKEAL